TTRTDPAGNQQGVKLRDGPKRWYTGTASGDSGRRLRRRSGGSIPSTTDADLAMLHRAGPSEISHVISNSEFQRNLPHILGFMKESRRVREQPADLFALQRQMAVDLIGMQESRRAYAASGDSQSAA